MPVYRLTFLVSASLLLVATRATAAPLTDRQVAQSLFEQARELMARKDYAKACPMFSESQRLDPGGGTLLNLALCYEGEGKLATAQLALSDALSQAVRDGRSDRETIAREHLASLASRVPKLTLVAPEQAIGGLVIELDGVAMSSAASGVSLPVDPGSHEVRATAPGYVTWTSIERLREGEQLRVQVPGLPRVGMAVVRLPSNAPRSSEPPPASAPKSKVAIASWVLGGVGAAALTASLATGAFALNARSEFEERCFAERNFCSTASDGNLAGTARNLAWVSTGLLVTAIAAGVTAWFWPRAVRSDSRAARSHSLSLEF